MGKIFYVMGKSASGKDTIYKELRERIPELKTVVLYTTRPIRDGETEGVEYHFTTAERLGDFRREKRLIEERTYQTVYGPWSYFTVDDGQICLDRKDSYLMIGTLESYEKMRGYFGENGLVPVYIEVDDGVRLERALQREKGQKEPKYKELCRRFLAAEEDFKEVINIWDRNDSNRERKERYHEIGRSVVPLEYGAAKDGVIFPLPHNKVLWKQILKGDFIDTIFNCPFEMHELVEDEKLSDTIYNLKPEHKELLYYLIVKNLSPRQIAAIKQCTDRNIRKVKTTLLNKLRLEAGYEQYI